MSRHTKERKKAKKIEKNTELVKEQNVTFDIIALLRDQQLDSKPNMGKFLSTYVASIRASISQKLEFYPMFKYELTKIFVRFIDGHELIYDILAPDDYPKYYMYMNVNEELLKDKQTQYVKQFFDYLLQFKFVY